MMIVTQTEERWAHWVAKDGKQIHQLQELPLLVKSSLNEPCHWCCRVVNCIFSRFQFIDGISFNVSREILEMLRVRNLNYGRLAMSSPKRVESRHEKDQTTIFIRVTSAPNS